MADLIGQTLLGRYQVSEKLGSGGMADVYKVWDQSRSVYLAAKFIHENMAMDLTFMRRFEREANTLKKLQHPHIVRFYELEQDEAGNAFMLLDYVEGSTLQRVIFEHKGLVPIALVNTMMQGVCSALQYAHNLGLVHMDIKPSNVMRDAAGKFVLADFGIARVTETATATMVGTGTPAYMAPEQIRGEDPLPQTDMYPLGIILYEMLTGGERPFKGERATITGSTAQKVRWEHLNLEARPPREINPNISPALEAVILRCMEKDPARRYADMTVLFNAYMQAVNVDAVPVAASELTLDTMDVLAVPPGTTRPSKWRDQAQGGSWTSRVPDWAWVSVGLVVVVGLFALAFAFGDDLLDAISFDSGGSSSRSSSRDDDKNKNDEPEDEDAEEPDADEDINVPNEVSTIAAETVEAMLTSTAEAVIAIAPTDTPIPQPTVVPTYTSEPVVDNGRDIVFHSKTGSDNDYEIYAMNANGGSVMKLTNNSSTDISPSWSNDGRIAFTSNRDGDYEVFVMDADGSDVYQVTDNNKRDGSPCWLQGSKYLVYESGDGAGTEIIITDFSGKGQLTNNSYKDWDPACSPNGQYIAFSSDRDGDGEIFIMNVETENVTQLTHNGGINWGAAWSPNGSQIAFASNYAGSGYDIYVVTIATGEMTRLIAWGGREGWPSYSPDGRYLLFISDEGGKDIIYRYDFNNNNTARIYDGGTYPAWPRWRP